MNSTVCYKSEIKLLKLIRYSPRPGHPVVRSRYATLTVLVAPDDPVITQGDVFQATEDREIELECVSANGKPAAEVSLVLVCDKSRAPINHRRCRQRRRRRCACRRVCAMTKPFRRWRTTRTLILYGAHTKKANTLRRTGNPLQRIYKCPLTLSANG